MERINFLQMTDEHIKAKTLTYLGELSPELIDSKIFFLIKEMDISKELTDVCIGILGYNNFLLKNKIFSAKDKLIGNSIHDLAGILSNNTFFVPRLKRYMALSQ